MVFIIDTKTFSPSQDRPLWEFARHVIELVDFDDKWVRVRFVHDWQSRMSGLDEKPFIDKDALLRAVNSAVDDKHMTSADLIESMLKLFSSSSPETSAPDRQLIGIIVTDGSLTDRDDVIEMARRATLVDRVELFAVGVGPDVSEGELRNVVGARQRQFSVKHPSKSQTVAKMLADELCKITTGL